MLKKLHELKKRLTKNSAIALKRREVRAYKDGNATKCWSDWLIPFKYNVWVQLGTILLMTAVIKVIWVYVSRQFSASALIMIFWMLWAGMLILGSTEFGRGTVRSYRRVRQILDDSGTEPIFEVQLQNQIAKKMYCYRVGARVAAAEKGLSKRLLPKLANRWRLL
jgi:hypothetical protein